MYRLIVIFSLLFSCLIFSYGKDYEGEFFNYFNNNDFNTIKNIISEWSNEQPDNSELFICINLYYKFRNAKRFIHRQGLPEAGTRELNKDELDEIFGGQVEYEYDKNDVYTGIKYLRNGLNIYSNRLDYHLEIIQSMHDIDDYNMGKSEMLKIIDKSKHIDNHWLWKHNQILKRGTENFLENIVGFSFDFFNNQSNYIYGYEIAKSLINNYPKRSNGYNLMGAYLMKISDYKNALKYNLKALSFNNSDADINNVGICYYKLKDYKNALYYFKINLNSKTKYYRDSAMYHIDEIENIK